MAYTLTQLKLLVRQRANMENSSLVDDTTEMLSYVNDSYAELYDLLTNEFEDYFLSGPTTFTIASGAYSYPLPADFYKLRGVDIQLNGSTDWATLRQFNFAERNSRSRIVSRMYNGSRLEYRVMGQNIYFSPVADAPGTYRYWYVPRYTPLVNGSDTLGDCLDFAEYVIIDAAIKCLIKEESDISALSMQKQGMQARILTMAKNRNIDQPERIADVTRAYTIFDDFFPRG